MAVIIGFIMGYAFANRLGAVDFKKSSKAFGEIMQADETKSLIAGTTGIARTMIRQAIVSVVREAIIRRGDLS